jgi:hypothetical protein
MSTDRYGALNQAPPRLLRSKSVYPHSRTSIRSDDLWDFLRCRGFRATLHLSRSHLRFRGRDFRQPHRPEASASYRFDLEEGRAAQAVLSACSVATRSRSFALYRKSEGSSSRLDGYDHLRHGAWSRRSHERRTHTQSGTRVIRSRRIRGDQVLRDRNHRACHLGLHCLVRHSGLQQLSRSADAILTLPGRSPDRR